MPLWLKIIAPLIILTIAGIAAWFYFNRDSQTIRTATVANQTVTQDISFTGRLQSNKVANLSFESAGRLKDILVAEGDAVTTGQRLASLDASSSELGLAKTYADKLSAQEQKKIAWQTAVANLANVKLQNEATLDKRRQAVRDAKDELDQDRQVHEQSAREYGDDSTTTDVYIAALLAGETAYHAAQQALDESLIASAKAEDEASRGAELAEAGYLATIQAASGTSSLSSLGALEALAINQLENKTLTAPFAGLVTHLNKEIGEIALAQDIVLTVETTDKLGIVANVTETDAAKLATGQSATITFDAWPPPEQWSAKVSKIAPAAQMIEGVPTYEVTLQLEQPDAKFKPGLTANITVHAARRENVLAVPRRAVFYRDSKQYVLLLGSDNNLSEQEVTTGLAGSAGLVEVTQGLTAGQAVVIDAAILEKR